MKSSPLYLLILENDLRLSETIRAHLQRTLPDVTPLLARTVAEANVFIYQYEFSAFLVGLNSSDGHELEFMVDLKTVMPDAPLLIMVNSPKAEIEQTYQHMGRYDILQKPLDVLELEQKLAVLFPEVAKAPLFYGSVRQMRLVDLIQVKCLNKDNCQLVITGPTGDNGVIVISVGDIVHARTDHLAGIDAFNEVLSWKRGFFRETEFAEGVEANIAGRWDIVLMEAVQRSDECCALEVV
jgi:DNA-binding response OmpR family regulator